MHPRFMRMAHSAVTTLPRRPAIEAMILRGMLACLALLLAMPSWARPPSQPTKVSGGEAQIAFNPDAMAELGLEIRTVEGAIARTPGRAGMRHDVTRFAAGEGGGIGLLHDGGTIAGLGEGALRYSGGLVIGWPGGAADLRGFVLRAGGGTRFDIMVAGADGTFWFSADHAHYGFAADAPHDFSMSHMNLRLAPHFAQALGRPELSGRLVGNLEFRAHVRDGDAGASASGGRCAAPWPGPGRKTDIEVFNSNLSGFWDSVYAPRCGLPPLPKGGACTATSTNGRLVLGADASLRNVGGTAIAWYGHFSGEHAPYGNDQHPFLIWNLYRIDGAGRIKQIGASGVKHAFYSINKNCGCAAGNVFWPGCEDIYSASSNDNGGGIEEQNLAPRSEIVPFGVKWGRCGSVWDADCDGRMDAGSGARDLYQYRLQANESDLLPPLSDGAQYFFEYWYLVRDDADLYNTMGHRRIQPRKNGANWSVPLVGADAPERDFFIGPTINRWVDPAAPSPNATNRELATPLGRARVAMKATGLGGGRWRYEYAVMNFDYAHARIDPAHAGEPNLKVLSNHGFGRFSVPLPRGVHASDLRFDDADAAADNDWRATTRGGAVTWTAPPSGNTLDWGLLFHFEFVADAAPAADRTIMLVGVATDDAPALPYTLALPGP